MTTKHDYDRAFNDAFYYVQDKVDARLGHQNYNWLLENESGLVPDYFTICSIGRTGFQRLLNYTISNHLKGFSPSYVVLKRFVTLFYDIPVLAAYQQSFQWLLKRLKHAPKKYDALDIG